MEEFEEELREELEKARQFFIKQQKNDRCFYRLYDVKFADSDYGRNDLRASNFDTTSLPESIKRLEEDIRSLGSRSRAFWVVKHYTAKNDPQPITIVLKNVYYNPENYKTTNSGNHINGFGQPQGNINGIVGLLQEHHKETTDLRNKFLEYKHEQELSKLQERVEELEYAKRGKFDAINEFLETPIGTQLGTALLQLLQLKLLGGNQQPIQQQPIQQQPVQQQPVQQDRKPQNTGDNANPDQQQQVVKINNALSRLHKVFGGDAINALEDVAIFCEQNPVMAQQFLHQKKQTQPPKNQTEIIDEEELEEYDDD